MPKPNKNESKHDYLKRCVSYLIENEKMEPDQAYALCNAYWNEENPVTLSFPLFLQNERVFFITAYTGDVVDLGISRYIFDLDNMIFDQKIPIFREHDPERIVGYSTKVWVSENMLFITGKFVNTKDADEIYKLIKAGFPFQASIGIWPKETSFLAEGESLEINGRTVEGPVEVWNKSQLREVSICALGADSATAAIALKFQPDLARLVEDKIRQILEEQKEKRLKELELSAPQPVSVAEEKPSLSDAELEICKRLNLDPELYLKTKKEVR